MAVCRHGHGLRRRILLAFAALVLTVVFGDVDAIVPSDVQLVASSVPQRTLATATITVQATGPNGYTENARLVIWRLSPSNTSTVLQQITASGVVAFDGASPASVSFPGINLAALFGGSVAASAIPLGVNVGVRFRFVIEHGPTFAVVSPHANITSSYNGTASISLQSAFPAVNYDDASTSVIVVGDGGATESVTLRLSKGAVMSTPARAFTFTANFDGGYPNALANISVVVPSGSYAATAVTSVTATALNISGKFEAYPRNLNLGGLFLRSIFAGFGDNAEVGSRIAVEMANADPALLPYTPIVFNARANTACTRLSAVDAILSLLQPAQCGEKAGKDYLDAIIGPACTSEGTSIVPVSGLYKIPVISFGASSTELSNKGLYPYFMRTHPSNDLEGLTAVAMALHFGWSQIALITMDSFPLDDNFRRTARSMNVTLAVDIVLQDKPDGSGDYRDALASIKQLGIRVIANFAYGGTGTALYRQAADLGIVGPGYQWVLGFAAYDSTLWPIRLQSYNSSHTWLDIFAGSFGTRVTTFGGNLTTVGQVVQIWNAKNMSQYAPENPSVSPTAGISSSGEPIGGLALTGSTGYDATTVAIKAYHRLIYGLRSEKNRADAYALMLQSDYLGVGGHLQFDANGDILAKRRTVQLRIDPNAARNTSARYYVQEWGFVSYSSTKIPSLTNINIDMDARGWYGYQWPGLTNATVPPAFLCIPACVNGACVAPNKCRCNAGWTGDTCAIGGASGVSSSSSVNPLAIALPVGLSVLSIIVAGVFLRSMAGRKSRALMNEKRNLIDATEISLGDKVAEGSFGEVYRAVFRGTTVAVKVLKSIGRDDESESQTSGSGNAARKKSESLIKGVGGSNGNTSLTHTKGAVLSNASSGWGAKNEDSSDNVARPTPRSRLSILSTTFAFRRSLVGGSSVSRSRSMAHLRGRDFLNEIDLLANLRHPHIVLYMGYCQMPQMAIVQEFMAKGSVFSLLQENKGQIDWNLKLRMACDAAMGVEYLHRNTPPIIHRDLKTPNLLIDNNFVVKVSDFGLAQFKNNRVTNNDTVTGSMRWMAPELFAHFASDKKPKNNGIRLCDNGL
eukprot:Opistho-2@35233